MCLETFLVIAIFFNDAQSPSQNTFIGCHKYWLFETYHIGILVCNSMYCCGFCFFLSLSSIEALNQLFRQTASLSQATRSILGTPKHPTNSVLNLFIYLSPWNSVLYGTPQAKPSQVIVWRTYYWRKHTCLVMR